MNIALLGPSGVGKGTHAELLTGKFNLFHLCTGQLFRYHLKHQTALGLQAWSHLDRGELVPDDIVQVMIDEQLESVPREMGILFDGFPRTTAQARFLADRFHRLGRTLNAVVYLHLSDKGILRRVSNRLICSVCAVPFHRTAKPFEKCPSGQCRGEHLYQRPDDSIETNRTRLKVFRRTIGPLLELYHSSGNLICLSAAGTIHDVGRELIRSVESLESGAALSRSTLTVQEVIKSLELKWAAPAEVSSPSLNLVLIGAPGSGKGTQAEALSSEFNLPHISAGDLFRENLKKETALGKLARSFMDRGELVPDEVTDAMIEDRLHRPDMQHGVLLDGFPRTIHQAEVLNRALAEMGRTLTAALYIQIPDDQIISRLSGRRLCQSCESTYHLSFKPPKVADRCDRCGGALYRRNDDNPKVIEARLKVFYAQTEPVIEFYESRHLLHRIDGAQDISTTIRDTSAVVMRLTGAKI